MRNVALKAVLVCITLVMMSFFFTGSGYAKIDPKTIAGLWLFNENKGDIAGDSSGNRNDGTLIGKPKWIKGKFGAALEFDGTNYVQVADSDSLDMTKQITVVFWVETTKTMKDMWNDRQAVVGKHYLEYEVGIYMGGQIHTYTSDGAGNYDEGIMTSIQGKLPTKEADWELGKWYHIAWTLDGSREVAYVNGIKLGDYNKAHANTKPGIHPLEIGRRVEGSIPLTGAVDEVAVFNVALGEADIIAIMEKGFEAALGLTAVYPADKLTTTWAGIKRN